MRINDREDCIRLQFLMNTKTRIEADYHEKNTGLRSDKRLFGEKISVRTILLLIIYILFLFIN